MSASNPGSGAALQGVAFKVEDMTCAHCVGSIRKALEAGMPGTPFAIDLDTHRVTVAGDAATAEAILRDVGYEPVMLAP